MQSAMVEPASPPPQSEATIDPSQRICLAMIVKNEAKIIARCLTSIKPSIDHWAIVDTGSTDDTMGEIERVMSGVPGVLVQREWQGFGDAKTTALDLARMHMNGEGYALVVDADELISGEIIPSGTKLTHESYALWMQLNNVRYRNVRLFRLDRAWRYEGVLHEFPTTDGPWTAEGLEAVITTPRDGARAQETDRYKKDAEILEAEIAELPDDSGLKTRYMFYLAQSYRDCGQDGPAHERYLTRAAMGAGLNWEEIYVSLLEAGRCMDRLGRGVEAETLYLRAHHQWPDRAEALRSLKPVIDARLRSAEAKQPVGALFVEDSRGGISGERGFLPTSAVRLKRHGEFFADSVKNLRQVAIGFKSEYETWPIERAYNGWFESGDLELYYAMLRSLVPERIIEIGCGFATAASAEACGKNGRGVITCIDPNPRTDLPAGVTFIRSRVEDVDPAVLDTLRSGDLLFIDSSHEADEALYHCLILERLRPGVVVHHHDCMYPGPAVFPEETVLMGYYDLQRSRWEGLISNAVARTEMGPEAYAEIIPSYQRNTGRIPGSIYTRKRR